MKAILTVNYLIFQRELLQQQKQKPYHFSGVIANQQKEAHFTYQGKFRQQIIIIQGSLCGLNINPVLMTPPFINHFQSNLLMKSFFSVNQSYNVNLQGRKRAVQKWIPGLELFIENHYPNEIRAPLVSYFNRTLSYRVSSGYRLSIFIVYDQFIRNSSKPYTFAFQINIRMGVFKDIFEISSQKVKT